MQAKRDDIILPIVEFWAIQFEFSVTWSVFLATATHNFKWLNMYVTCEI